MRTSRKESLMQIQKVNSCQAQAVSPPTVSFSRAHHFGDSITTTAQGSCFSRIWKTVTSFFSNLLSFFGLCFGCVKRKSNENQDTGPAKNINGSDGKKPVDPSQKPTHPPRARSAEKKNKSSSPAEDQKPAAAPGSPSGGFFSSIGAGLKGFASSKKPPAA